MGGSEGTPETRPGDNSQHLRDRLAALDGLHADGHLTDEEHVVARQMAISGAVAPDAPLSPAGEARGAAPPELPDGGGAGTDEGRPPWILPAAAGVLAAAIVALVVVLIFTLSGGGSEAPVESASNSSAGGRAVRVTKTLNALYVGSSSGRCFGPRSGASFTLGGTKLTTDFLNCGDDNPSVASGTYEFKDLPDGTLKSFSATLAIDEGSYRAQRDSSAHFLVTYGDKLLCEATVTWGSPHRCRRPRLNIPTSSGTLVIEQDVQAATTSPTAGLWVGVVGGRVGVSVKR